jgi:hypothetical protein
VDASELLDVDVDELAGSSALVALRGLQAEPAELAHPDPRQDARDRRERHPEQFGDLGAGEAQPAQRGDRLDAVLAGACRDRARSRGTIQQADRAFGLVAGAPLARGALADSGRHGGLRQRPPRAQSLDQQLATFDAEPGVSVQLHPVSSLD